MAVITPEKIEEWIKEVEERPASASIILQYISNRLRDLTDRNEQLLEENIALLSGKKVEEYEKKIAHLEYQLEILKRQVGSDLSMPGGLAPGQNQSGAKNLETLSLLVYSQQGRIMRFEFNPFTVVDEFALGRIQGEILIGEEAPRLLVIPSTAEVMSVYSSGRINTFPIMNIPCVTQIEGSSGVYSWEQAILPDEPRGGERLACLMPVSQLPMAEFFVQISRRGFVKKIRTSMAQSILTNHYIGTGVKQPLDRTFNICLSGKEDQTVLVSHEGFLLRLEINRISSSTEEAIRLSSSDHLISSFIFSPGSSVLVMTQLGKAVQITEDRLEVATSLKTKGQAVFSAQRREKGARVVGAGSTAAKDWAVGLHRDGQITLHSISGIFASGMLSTQSELLSFETFPSPMSKG